MEETSTLQPTTNQSANENVEVVDPDQPTPQPQVVIPPLVKATLKKKVSDIVGDASIPGCTLAIWDVKNRTMLLNESVGVSNVESKVACEANTTTYHAFSTTKLFTATAIMKLVEEDKFQLETKVGAILSHAPSQQKYAGILPQIRDITIRQLLSHSSGLSDSPLRSVLAVHGCNSTSKPSTADTLGTYLVPNAPSQLPATASYANINYVILGEIISVVSEIPYETYVIENILKPWGSNARFTCSRKETTMATGYVNCFTRLALYLVTPTKIYKELFKPLSWYPVDWFSGYQSLNNFDLSSAAVGGLVGTVNDLVSVFDTCDVNSDGLISKTSKQLMLDLQAVGSCGVCSRNGMGLGWKHGQSDNNRLFFNHEGGGGGFTSEVRYYPEQDIGVALMMNKWSLSMSECVIAHKVCELLCDEVESIRNSGSIDVNDTKAMLAARWGGITTTENSNKV